jgi:CheY-like chemotaxis protein
VNEPLIRVLLVDDEELVRSAILAWLEDDRFLITEANSGANALELLAEQCFDCGILDLNLKDMTGVDVLKSARYLGRKPFWLLMTGNLDTETYQDLRDMGFTADLILLKPIFNMQQITNLLLTAVAHYSPV